MDAASRRRPNSGTKAPTRLERITARGAPAAGPGSDGWRARQADAGTGHAHRPLDPVLRQQPLQGRLVGFERDQPRVRAQPPGGPSRDVAGWLQSRRADADGRPPPSRVWLEDESPGWNASRSAPPPPAQPGLSTIHDPNSAEDLARSHPLAHSPTVARVPHGVHGAAGVQQPLREAVPHARSMRCRRRLSQEDAAASLQGTIKAPDRRLRWSRALCGSPDRT